MTKKHCITCGLPIHMARIETEDSIKWLWVHDATIGHLLRTCLSIGVPLSENSGHGLLRMKRATFQAKKEASIG